MTNDSPRPLEAWTSLLSISTRFEMARVRSRAIKEINDFRPPIDPVDQVILAVKHNVPDWLPTAYAALSRRKEPIRHDEGERLGMKTTTSLAEARESIREKHRLKTSTELDDSIVRKVVESVFYPTTSALAPAPLMDVVSVLFSI